MMEGRCTVRNPEQAQWRGVRPRRSRMEAAVGWWWGVVREVVEEGVLVELEDVWEPDGTPQ